MFDSNYTEENGKICRDIVKRLNKKGYNTELYERKVNEHIVRGIFIDKSNFNFKLKSAEEEGIAYVGGRHNLYHIVIENLPKDIDLSSKEYKDLYKMTVKSMTKAIMRFIDLANNDQIHPIHRHYGHSLIKYLEKYSEKKIPKVYKKYEASLEEDKDFDR